MATFTAADLEQLKAKGISQERVEAQLECFRTGFPYLKIDSPSSLGHGIAPVDADLENACLARWNDFLADGGDVLKFVPASGAASRMFKALFAFVNGTESVPAEGSPVAQLVERIGDFAFYKELEAATIRLYGKTPTELVKEGRFKELVGAIILPDMELCPRRCLHSISMTMEQCAQLWRNSLPRVRRPLPTRMVL